MIWAAIKRYFGRVYQRGKSMAAGRRLTAYDLRHDDGGLKVEWLTVEGERGHREVTWSDVASVYVFKRDVFAHDLICTAVNSRGGEAVEVNERMGGWESLARHLPSYLDGCRPIEEWFGEVARPPFAENMTLIYRHDERHDA